MSALIEVWDADEPSRRGIDREGQMRLIRDDIAVRIEVPPGELRAEE